MEMKSQMRDEEDPKMYQAISGGDPKIKVAQHGPETLFF